MSVVNSLYKPTMLDDAGFPEVTAYSYNVFPTTEGRHPPDHTDRCSAGADNENKSSLLFRVSIFSEVRVDPLQKQSLPQSRSPEQTPPAHQKASVQLTSQGRVSFPNSRPQNRQCA